MEIGRNIGWDDRYYITFRFNSESIMRKWFFTTHRGAMRKFNQLKQNSDWLPIQEDVTI